MTRTATIPTAATKSQAREFAIIAATHNVRHVEILDSGRMLVMAQYDDVLADVVSFTVGTHGKVVAR